MAECNDKVVIITGAGTLLGAEVAKAMMIAGAKVVLVDINENAGKEIVSQLEDNVLFIKTDVTDSEQLDACIETVIQQFGRIDCVVNAAVSYIDNGLESSREDWWQSFNTNTVSPVILIQKALPYLRQNGGGAVVNFSSMAANRAQGFGLLYSTSKAAIEGVTRNLALLLSDNNIRVNSISPGMIWSNPVKEMTGNDRDKADKVAADHLHIINRCGNPEEVADLVVFLCSNKASFITGADFAIDGGASALGPLGKKDLLKLME